MATVSSIDREGWPQSLDLINSGGHPSVDREGWPSSTSLLEFGSQGQNYGEFGYNIGLAHNINIRT